jgi:hypothetical protein
LEENAHELDGLKKRLGRNLVKEKCRRDGTEKPIAPQKKKNHLVKEKMHLRWTGQENRTTTYMQKPTAPDSLMRSCVNW